MKVRSLVMAVTWAIACSGASSAVAGTSAAFSDDDSTAVFGQANLTSLQDVGGNATLGAPSASVDADALRKASGNIGVNLSAGALNAQTNQIALVSTPHAQISTQQNLHSITRMTGSATTELSAGALAAVSGNVGVNIAAGVGNAQFNGMVVH